MAAFRGQADDPDQYYPVVTADRPATRPNTTAQPSTHLRQHSQAFPLGRDRDATPTSLLTNSASARLSAARSANELMHADHRRHSAAATPSYEYRDYLNVTAVRRHATSFPYHLSYPQPRSAPPDIDDMTQRPPTRLVRPVVAAAAAPESAYQPPPPSSSSSRKPRQKRRPKTAEEKRSARECSVDGCKNYTIDRGLCFRHGGGKSCTVEGCDRSAKARGLCWHHGGSVRCTVEGCDRGAKSKGLCWSHGGGTKCSIDGCEKTIISKGVCWTHGGGKRCSFEGCMRPASQSKQNFCNRHHAELSDGKTVYEV